MAQEFRSLKFDLLFDLSVLTFCSVILSEGLLVVILRSQFPAEVETHARDYLSNLHESFLLTNPGIDRLSAQDVYEAFDRRKQEHSPFAKVSLRIYPAEAVTGTAEWSVVRRNFLLFLPTIDAFRMTRVLTSGRVWTYEFSLVPFHELLSRYKFVTFLFTILIQIGLITLGYWILFRRNVIEPINRLNQMAHAFLEGNWSKRIPVERRDELGRVAEALTEMASKIQEKENKLILTIESLKKANEEIELAQQEQLQIEKLASIGRLAAGVAHEVGNPLGAISGYIDILRSSLRGTQTGQAVSAEDLDLLDRIESETNRISKIIRALLQQARPAKDRLRDVTLKPVLVRCVQLARIPPGIDVSYDFESEDAEVYAEEDQLVQVFLNLLMNAAHAIELAERADPSRKGAIRIRVAKRKLPVYSQGTQSAGAPAGFDMDTSVVRALKPQAYWVTSVEDNGVGISEADQRKLFEPFFSTKPPGKGTGLGLYVTKSIIESFRGAIVVRSAKGFGTSFSVFLPVGR